ncbi:junctional adhesion molecule A [Anoplopoma fimbria]|uniref:junctional adhesion molecule A n=1 Tax=Anoplopoma fimbria TaxID=229290 RepID=UPI0023EDB0ED|nr:junctional adhesion molecule A [Anoplopoma fimbria]
MASISVLLIFSVISISIGNANAGDFLSVKCKAENLGQYGGQTLLECVIKTTYDDTEIRVVLWKNGSHPLLIFNKGETSVQEPGYLFAEPSWNFRNMNVSLLIANTTVEHEGSYTCTVMTDRGSGETSTSLKVSAKYNKPTITIPETITMNSEGNLTCFTDGGYPKADLRWFDEHNTELTKDSQMMTSTKGDLFQLSSKLVVKQGSSVSKYTCVVFNATGGKEEETTVEVQDMTNPRNEGLGKDKDPTSKIVAPVVVIGSLIVGLLFALLIYRRRSQRDHCPVDTSDDKEGDPNCTDNFA